MTQAVILAGMLLVAAEGLLGAAVPQLHFLHAPVKGTPIHCHHGEPWGPCPETHGHLGSG